MRPQARRVVAGTMVAGALMIPLSASSSDWIQGFYNAAGAAANITPGQAITSQTMNGYSGGGVTWRIPNKNFQPLQITPPSFKAGCGGIDFYLGGYSFPNKAAFVSALRNFGQAALGQFFMLSLRTMAPEIAVTLQEINDQAQKVNQFGKNSCELATSAVGSMTESQMREANARASAWGSKMGSFVDQFDGDYNNQAGGHQAALQQKYSQYFGGSTTSSANVPKSQSGDLPAQDFNFVRWALDHADNLSGNLNDEEKDIMMSLIGPTFIVKTVPKTDITGTDVTPVVSGAPQTLFFEDLVGDTSLQPVVVPLKLLTCPGGGTDNLCLNPTPTTNSIWPFGARVASVMAQLRAAIQNNVSPLNTLSTTEKDILNLTSVPLARTAALAESGGVAASIATPLVGDIIAYGAIDGARHFVEYYLQQADKAMDLAAAKPENQNLVKGPIADIRARTKEIRRNIQLYCDDFYKKHGDPVKKMEQLEKAERLMYSQLTTMLAANARFGKRQ